MTGVARALVTVVFGAVALAGCGGATDTAACEDIADQTIAIFQNILDEASSGDPAQIAALQGEMTEQITALQEDATAANCTDDQMRELLAARVDDLEGEGPIADAVRQSLEQSFGN